MRYQEACAILQVRPGCATDEIKRAYRRLVREYHPDYNRDEPDALERFHRLQEAYRLLLDVSVHRAPTLQQQLMGSTNHRQPKDVLEGRVPRRVEERGPDVRGEVRLSLQEAFTGTVSDITFQDEVGCERCGATGGEPSSTRIPCPGCEHDDPDCVWCRGEGELPDQPCKACMGAGVVEQERTVRVKIPRSVMDGEEKVVAGKGKWGKQERGDLRLRIRVEEPEYMHRKGDDLEVEVSIGVLQAVLGGYTYVPTLDGVLHKIRVAPGSSSGKRYRIKGQGMYKPGSDERGDLYAVLAIRVPDKLTEREQHLYQLLLEEEARREQQER